MNDIVKLKQWMLLVALGLTLPVVAQQAQIQSVRDAGLVGELYHIGVPAPAILLLGGSEGGIAWQGHPGPTERLAERGYTVLALAYFKEASLPETLNAVPLEYFDKTIRWLIDHELTTGDHVAIVGGSKGAEAALLIASGNESVAAVVVLSASAYVFQGIFHPTGEVRSSWARGGVDVPFAPFAAISAQARANAKPGEYIEMYRASVADPVVRARATIPVENITAPILLMSGFRDRLWASQEMSEAVVARLQRHGFRYDIAHKVFDAGHNVLGHRDAWPELSKFLGDHYPPRSIQGQADSAPAPIHLVE